MGVRALLMAVPGKCRAEEPIAPLSTQTKPVVEYVNSWMYCSKVTCWPPSVHEHASMADSSASTVADPYS